MITFLDVTLGGRSLWGMHSFTEGLATFHMGELYQHPFVH